MIQGSKWHNYSSLVQVMAWRLSGAKPLPEPMMTIDAYVTRLQCVKCKKLSEKGEDYGYCYGLLTVMFCVFWLPWLPVSMATEPLSQGAESLWWSLQEPGLAHINQLHSLYNVIFTTIHFWIWIWESGLLSVRDHISFFIWQTYHYD